MTSSASSPTRSTACSRGWNRRRRTAEIRSQCLPRAAHPAGGHADPLDVARNDQNRGNDELIDRLHAVNTRAIDLTEALLLLSRADQRSFAREHVDLSLIAEEATETLLPLAEKHGVTIETSGDATPTIGSPALLLQMATNLVHNAIVHNLPDHGTVWVTTSAHPKSCGAHRREHRREAHPTAGRHACRAVSARHRTHTHRHAGVGLGLAIVKSITQAHEGTLTLTPGPVGGSASRCNYPPRTAHRQITTMGIPACPDREPDGCR